MHRITRVRLTCLFTVLGLITFFVLYYRSGGTAMSQRKNESNQSMVPFEMVDETRNDGLGGPMWVARFVVPKEHYTQQNLDLLFCSYSKRHMDKNERLRVRVYTDSADVPRGDVPTPPHEPQKVRRCLLDTEMELPREVGETRSIPTARTQIIRVRGKTLSLEAPGGRRQERCSEPGVFLRRVSEFAYSPMT